MLDQTDKLPRVADDILGDLTGLAEQLGHAEGLVTLTLGSLPLSLARVDSVSTLTAFLEEYAAAILFPHELPAIARAFRHAALGQARELLACDRQLGLVPVLQPFARASTAVGRTQLRRLRPLRTERVVQKYWRAVEQDQAQAWHTLVFGLVLSLYSLPLRQGLVHYARQTLGGFVEAAPLQLSAGERLELFSVHSKSTASAVNTLLADSTVDLGGLALLK